MFRRLAVLALITASVCAVVAIAQTEKPAQVPYPEGYRDWTHVKSMALLPGHELYNVFGGIHHVYANDKALTVLKGKTNKYPDGAIFVFDLLDHSGDSTALTEGERKVLGVMYKDAAKFEKTGGWGFEGFSGNSRDRVVTDGGESCFLCHDVNAKESAHVFSQWRD